MGDFAHLYKLARFHPFDFLNAMSGTQRERFQITDFFMCADVNLGTWKDKYTFTLGGWARKSMPHHALYVDPASEEWVHWEGAINALIAHVQARCEFNEWKAYLENKVALEVAIKMDQSEGSDAQQAYKMELYVRIGELDDDDGERVLTATFAPQGAMREITFDEHWIRVKRGKQVGDAYITRYSTFMRASGFARDELDAQYKQPGAIECTCKKRDATGMPPDMWKAVFDMKTWGKQILRQQTTNQGRPNNQPASFGPSHFASSTVPTGYEVRDCPVRVDASNCLYLVPEKEDPATCEPSGWAMVANFCIQSCDMLIKWKDGDKQKTGVDLILVSRLVKVCATIFAPWLTACVEIGQGH